MSHLGLITLHVSYRKSIIQLFVSCLHRVDQVPIRVAILKRAICQNWLKTLFDLRNLLSETYFETGNLRVAEPENKSV